MSGGSMHTTGTSPMTQSDGRLLDKRMRRISKVYPLFLCSICVALTTVRVYGETAIPEGVSVICVDAETGLIIRESEADASRPQASLIKIMQMLLVAEGVENGEWTLDDIIAVSRHAQRMGGTQVYLSEGEEYALAQLMNAVAVASANDAAMAVAEGLWGSEEAYLARMNERTLELGMTNSEFHSVHGLPPDRGEEPDRTTARDMAILARHAVTIEQVLAWTDQKELRFRPEDAIIRSTNKLLRSMEDCDGLKTGYIRASGFCIVATAARSDIRLIAVVMGHPNSAERFKLAGHLLEEGFASIDKRQVITKGETEGPVVPVANCEIESVTLRVDGDAWATARVDDFSRLEVVMDVPRVIVAPMTAGYKVGEARVVLDGEVLSSAPLVLAVDLKEAGWWWKLRDRVDDLLGFNN